MEKTIQTKNCKHCNLRFEITNKDLEFYDKVSPKFNWKKYQIPIPTLCPDCRQQRRLSFRNERKLYRRDCDANWKSIISIYSPDKNVTVYNQEDWWSDSWDAIDYWKNFDFNKNFFEQFEELTKKVPKISNLVKDSRNCDYNVIMWNSKDCYSCSTTFQSENCLYTYWTIESKDCVDCSDTVKSESSYNCINCYNVYKLSFSQDCKDSRNSSFLYDCVWCESCFMCSWLRNKKYYIKNQQFDKKDYEKKLQEIKSNNSIEDLFNLYQEIKSKQIKCFYNWNKSYDSFWDYLTNVNNCRYCFNLVDAENTNYAYDSAIQIKDCLDISMIWNNVNLMYEAHASWYDWYKSIFVNLCWTNTKLIYCDYCMYCSDCFWCTWLKNKQYCILNKQYTKEEYNKLVPEIIEHMQKTWEWWEFFPSSISPFGYNETVAGEHFPLTKEEAKNKWFNWSDYEPSKPNVEKIIPAEKLPENIKEIPDDILNWAIKCEITQKPFRIIKQELEFYRKHDLPIPRKHPDQRHLERIQLRNPRKLFDRKCDKCWIEMKTTYAPDREEIVYCEKCYNEVVY